MQDTTWIATIAGIALGISVVLAIVFLAKKEDATQGVMYSYDDQNRLQGIALMDNNNKNIRLRQVM